jgi:hypothetical protein
MGLFSRLFGSADNDLKQRIRNLEIELDTAHMKVSDMEAHLLELRNVVRILTLAQTQMGVDMSEIYRALRAVVSNVSDEDLLKTNPFASDDDDDGYLN